MPDFDEFIRSLRGAFRLLMRDEGGYGEFAVSIGAFWRSFLLLILIFPLYYFVYLTQDNVLLAMSKSAGPAPQENPLIMAAVILSANWFAYPAIMALNARLFSLGNNYVPYIIVYNWAALLIMLLILPPFILYNMGVLSAGATMGLSFALSLITLYYHWFLARTALNISGVLASAFVAIDLLLSMSINLGIHRLAGG